jgi:hypothetical protein
MHESLITHCTSKDVSNYMHIKLLLVNHIQNMLKNEGVNKKLEGKETHINKYKYRYRSKSKSKWK